MSHKPTIEDLDALCKKLMGERDVCLLTPRDYVNAMSQELVWFDQETGAKVFRVFDKMPVSEGMGS